jgi:ribose-phosphate pyrophosphokinase
MVDIVVGPKDGFSERIAEKIGKPFAELERIVFPDFELKPKILGEVDLKGKDVLLVNRTKGAADFNPNRHMLEFLFTISNLKDMGASRVTVLMPYLIYARQDKVFLKGEPLSAKYVLELMKKAGADRLLTLSSHIQRKAGQITYYPGLDAYNISAFPAIGDWLKANAGLSNPVVIGPDLTSEKGADEVAAILGSKETAFQKKRDYTTGKVETQGAADVKGRDVVIVDDIAATGGTLEKAINICKQGGAKRIICVVAHPVLAGKCLERVKNTGAEFLATNTIDSEISKIDVTGAVAEYLKSQGTRS